MDDLLIAAETEEQCTKLTISLLNFLGISGYQVSKEKAQITQREVTYLGFEILKGQRQLGTERKEAICHLPEPKTLKEFRAFLGMVGWCCLWITNYDLVVPPLYEQLKTSNNGFIDWTDAGKAAFKELNQALTEAPALGLPDLSKTSELFTHERKGTALGVLAQ